MSLGRQFQERQVRKRYRAILVGRLEDSGTIDTALEERAARTRWAAVRHDRSLHCQWLTTVDLWPETGRTHQLRRHMAQLGHPVLGDDLYTEGRVLQRSGLFLAAVELQLTHPRSGEPLHFVLPEPSKFVTFREREERRWSRSRDA